MSISHRKNGIFLIIALAFSQLVFATNDIKKELKLVGEADLRVLFFTVYSSSLFTSQGYYHDGMTDVILEIQYNVNITAKQLIDRTLSEWEHQGLDEDETKKWIIEIKEIWPNISKNDVLTLYLKLDGKSIFYHNNISIGGISDINFGHQFLSIWLSKKTRFPKHRKRLLGI